MSATVPSAADDGDLLSGLPVDPLHSTTCDSCGAVYSPESVVILVRRRGGRCLRCGHPFSEPVAGEAAAQAARIPAAGKPAGCLLLWLSFLLVVLAVLATRMPALYRASHPPPRVVVPGDIAPAVSAPRVSGKASAKKWTRLEGTVSPAHRYAMAVDVQIYRKKKWQPYGSYPVGTDSGGAWGLKFKPGKGRYRAMAFTAAETGYLGGSSDWGVFAVE